jgi:hypothetical protein
MPTAAADRHLFLPEWWGRIRPTWPGMPPSRPTARAKAARDGATASGTIRHREEPLAREARVVGALRARKERAREAQAGRAPMDRMVAKAERRAAREAKRMGEARLRDLEAAFACDSPARRDGVAAGCAQCPYARGEVR